MSAITSNMAYSRITSSTVEVEPLVERDSLRYGRWLSHPSPDEEVMITGIAGKLPESEDLYQFRDNLFNNVDMITQNNRRWDLDHPEIPKRSGKLLNIEKFDSGYFGTHYRQTNSMDPMVRLLLERAVEAIVDAGYNPSELEGSRTGVYIGASFSETEVVLCHHDLKAQDFIMTGIIRSMIAHRISYFLKLKGPSHNLDTACSSSLYALEQAYKAIRTGSCDQALVGGINLCLNPFTTLQFARLGVLSKEGACKVFDVHGDGYVRSESANMLFLQKSKDSRRVYARVIHAKTNCDGFKPESITFPSSNLQMVLLNDIYRECEVQPSDLTYMEAHGTATIVGDPQEAESLDNVFCKNRTDPLLVGSVKSNIGHSEPGSGLCSVAKIIITMETGIIPANLNFTAVRDGIEALEKGRIKLVTENTPLPVNNGLIGVNNFGFGGSNAHALFQWNLKTKTKRGIPQDDLPRILCVSGRHSTAVTTILDDVKNRDLDAEYIRLYHQIFSKEFPNHLSRGYSILTKRSEVVRSVEMAWTRKPIFLYFSTFGDAWSNIAQELYQIPTFGATIERIDQVLAPNKVNILEIVKGISTKKSRPVFEQILGNMAVQVAIADVLKDIGVQSVMVFGSGLGEFVCGYFTNCLTLKETVLSIYHVALSLLDDQEDCASYLIKISADELEKLPTKVNLKEILSDSIVITGEPNTLATFKTNLLNQGVTVTKIDDGSVNFHGDHFGQIKSQLLKTLQTVIVNPKPKTWLSCYSNNNRASADYFLNSLNSIFMPNVLMDIIGGDALVMEIGNGQLRRQSENQVLSFEKNGQRGGNLVVFLKHLGSLHNSGQNLDLARLYPKIEYPVSRGTPMISPMIKWDHSKDWNVVKYEANAQATNEECIMEVLLSDESWAYISGHVIDGRNLMPATAYLNLVWRVYAFNKTMIMTDMTVVFENCRFLRATNIQKDQKLKFSITIQTGTGNFEVVESGVAVVTGRIYHGENINEVQVDMAVPLGLDGVAWMNSRDVYKELRLRGYNYKGAFKGIKKCNVEATSGFIQWDDNWVSFMDNMLQMQILQLDSRQLYVPVSIERLTIHAKKHISMGENLGDVAAFPVYACQHSKMIKSGGIEIRGLKASSIVKKRLAEDPVLEKYQFVPYAANISTEEAVIVNMQLALENLPGTKVKVVEIIDEEMPDNWEPLSSRIHGALSNMPKIQPDVTILSKMNYTLANVTVADRKLSKESDCTIVVGVNILQRPLILTQSLAVLKDGGYILSRQTLDFNIHSFNLPQIDILSNYVVENEILILIRKSAKYDDPVPIDVSDQEGFSWLPTIQEALRASKNVIAYVQNQSTSGILGLVNCIRREPGNHHVRCVFIDDPNVPPFDPQLPCYRNQLDKGLAINVYKNGSWGSYRHLLVGDLEEVESEHCFANTLVRGDLSTLRWIEGPLRGDAVLEPEEKLVHVYYSAMNFRDVMSVSGKLSVDLISKYRQKQEILQGFEFSGRTISGERVMGIVNCGAQATMLKADNNLIWPVPDEWTLEEAASVTLVYATLIYGMFMRSRIMPGDTILIHSGTGGVGIAAIRLALYHGCIVFTTVGTKEKREFLKKTFPEIKDSHIGNSRDTKFEQMILTQTHGRGVDVVLNSLSEEKLQASVRCLARGGRFLEIGKFDLSNNSELHLEFLKKEASFHGIMLDLMFESMPDMKQELRERVSEAIKGGAVKPLMRTVFETNQLEEAFRHMTSGKHMGKVLIKVRDEERERHVAPSTKLMKGIPRYFCESTMTYVIAGGLGGFGLELADWLVLRGATKLVLTSRTGLKTGYQAYRLRLWKSYGVQVEIRKDDIQTPDGCRQLLEAANNLGPVAAIFNLAMVLLDAILDNQTPENFQNSLAPKAYATDYFDQISREICPQLKDFVVFSSISCGRGNGGQSNYGMANSVMERICERRKAQGFPALAIEWGVVGDVGIVAELQEDDVQREIGGTLQQHITNCLQVLDVLMRQDSPIVASMVVAKRQAGSIPGSNLVEMSAQILGIKDLKTVGMHLALSELGMDSMTAVEIRQTLEREFQVFLSPQDVRNLTFSRLQELQDELSSKDESVEGGILEKSSTKFEMLISNLSGEGEATLRSIRLQTKAKDTEQSHQILLFPGIEGLGKALEPLAKNLNVPATSLQYCIDQPKNSIREIASAIVPTVEQLLSSTTPFRFVAYSHGTSIALELVNILEKKGHTCRLLCLDGGPEFIHTMINSQLETENEATFETALLCQFMSLVAPYNTILEIKDRLLACQDFDQRVSLCEAIVPKDIPHTKAHLREVATCLYYRVNVLKDYRPAFKIEKSLVKLYKPRQPSLQGLAEDYGLSNLCTEKVEVRVFEGNHVTMLENEELARAIDEFARLD